MTYFGNFGTPSVSWEWLELETLNLAHTLTTRGTDKRNVKIKSSGVGKGSHDLLWEFWDPLHILGMVGARNFKFGTHIDHQGH